MNKVLGLKSRLFHKKAVTKKLAGGELRKVEEIPIRTLNGTGCFYFPVALSPRRYSTIYPRPKNEAPRKSGISFSPSLVLVETYGKSVVHGRGNGSRGKSTMRQTQYNQECASR